MKTSTVTPIRLTPQQAFAGILPAEDIVTDGPERSAAASDVYGTGLAIDAVLLPRDTAQLAGAVAAATRAGFAIVTRGGGMSYTGGYLAERPGTIMIDTSRLNRIVEISEEDLYITVEAGVTWKQIHEALKPLGLRLPFFGTFSGARATVGGGLSNGALFLGTARFGTAADCMLGMEIVLADGTLLRTGQCAVQRASKPFYRTYGPDLSGLFIHDSGALGVKVQATFRLIRAPAHTGFASFVFDGMAAAGAALSEVARTAAAEEAYVFDPETTRRNLSGGDLVRDARTLLNVMRGEASLLKGVRQGAKLVGAGRDFMPDDAYSLHVVCTGRTEAALEADLAACREACERLGGREIVDSIPRAVRASLFPEPDAVLGPDGERWAALNAKVAHSDAQRIIRACREALEPHRAEMDAHRVWMSHLLIAIGTNAFSFEPVFHWYDEWLPIHERLPSPSHLAKLRRPPADPAARELVARLRTRLIDVFTELGAASNQIGKTYPYLDVLEPATARLLRGLKSAVDPEGAMNPGGLGLR